MFLNIILNVTNVLTLFGRFKVIRFRYTKNDFLKTYTQLVRMENYKLRTKMIFTSKCKERLLSNYLWSMFRPNKKHKRRRRGKIN